MKTRMFLVVAALVMFASLGFGQGFAVAWIDIEHPLRASTVEGCEAGEPLADGWWVEIHQDVDGDGPDAEDPMPAAGDQPGNVNFNQFQINGVALGIGPGTFYTDPAWSSVGSPPPGPNNWYLVVRCADGAVHYVTHNPQDPMGNYHFTGNPTEQYTDNHWVCVPCVPEVTCTPEVVTFYRDPVPWYDCAVVCPQLPTIIRVCPNPGEALDPAKTPIVSVVPGCDPVNTNCDSVCQPAFEFLYNPDGWSYDPLTGCFVNVIIGLSEGCVCITLEGFLAVGFNNDFVAQPLDGAVKMSWSTNSEIGLARYDILRNAEKIGEVAAANAAHDYNYVDETAVNGTTYTYTLRVVNADATMSELATVQGTPSFGAAVITEYALHQNFPNPFNPSTSLTFDVVDKNFVSLKVFNAAGQEVGTVANSEYEAGRHTVNFSAANLPSGLYFYTVKIGNEFSATKKMLLVK